MKILSTALAAAILLSSQTGAFAKQREAVSFSVPTDGVDFKDPASVANFRKRVSQAISQACAPADEIQTGRAPDFECARSMKLSSDTRIAALQVKSSSAMAIME